MGVVAKALPPYGSFDAFHADGVWDQRLNALRDLRRQHAYLLGNLPGVVYRCEAALPWKMLFISEKVHELTGHRREEFEGGFEWGSIVHPDDLPRLQEIVEQAIEGSQEFAAIYRVIHTCGEARWVKELAHVVHGEDSALYLEGFVQDITEQRDLEEAVRLTEKALSRRAKVLEQVLESTNDCVYSLDQWWRISYVNSAAQEYLGVSNSIVGTPILEVFTDTDSPFKDALTRAMDLREGSTVQGFLPSRQSWYELKVTPTPGGITVFFRDTTEQQTLREQEQENATRWKETLNAIPQMVWSMGAGERQPDFYNARWYEFTGLPAGSITGPEWAELFHPDDRESSLAHWRRARLSGESYEAEYRVRDRQGNYRWVVSRGHAETDEHGAIIRWYGTCTDVHERLLDRLTLENSERHSKNILRSIPQIIWCADAKGNLDFINGRWDNGEDSTPLTPLGQGWLDAVHPDDQDSARTQWAACVRDGGLYEAAFRIRQSTGNYVWTLVRGRPEVDETGKIVRWYGTCTDIHTQITAQQALEKSEQLNRGIVEASPDCMSVLDAEGTVLYVNSAAASAYGEVEMTSLVGRSWGSAFEGRAALESGGALDVAKGGGVGRLVLKGGTGGNRWYDVAVAPILDDSGTPQNFLVSSRDFTDRKLAEERAHWAANHDSLTELPNRFLFYKRLEEELDKNKQGAGFALLIFDVDYLKCINDGMGHDAGDALLREVANRLASQVGPDDIVARLGGDEFGILLSRTANGEAVEKIVAAMKERLAAPFTYAGKLVDCQGSIGASLYPLHASQCSELMKCADVALYAAKQSSKGHLCIYDPAMRDQTQRRLSMLSLARSALRNDSIVPFYQPKVSLADGRVLGFEALLRWRDYAGRLHFPKAIAAAFEDADLASQISDCMIDAVLDDVRAWLDDGTPFGHVALNAGSVELRQQNFVDILLEKLIDKSIPTDRIQLEVTETVFLGRGSDHIKKALTTLSKEGVKLALDDFGTGFASLTHLNTFPVDYIKIDRSFVEDINTGKGGEAIVEAIIGLGKSLGMEIVAEGIENLQQHNFLVKRHCQFAQGFHYSEAVPADNVLELITRFSGHCEYSAKQSRVI